MYEQNLQPQLRRNKNATSRKGGAVVKREDNRAQRAARFQRKDRLAEARERDLMVADND